MRQDSIKLTVYTQGHDGNCYVFSHGKSNALLNVRLLNMFFHSLFVMCLSSTLPLTVSSCLSAMRSSIYSQVKIAVQMKTVCTAQQMDSWSCGSWQSIALHLQFFDVDFNITQKNILHSLVYLQSLYSYCTSFVVP